MKTGVCPGPPGEEGVSFRDRLVMPRAKDSREGFHADSRIYQGDGTSTAPTSTTSSQQLLQHRGRLDRTESAGTSAVRDGRALPI
jgi:hypothetical protein